MSMMESLYFLDLVMPTLSQSTYNGFLWSLSSTPTRNRILILRLFPCSCSLLVRFSSMQIVRPTNHRTSSRRTAPSSRRSTGHTRSQAQSTSWSCVRSQTACLRGEARTSGFFSIFCFARHCNAGAYPSHVVHRGDDSIEPTAAESAEQALLPIHCILARIADGLERHDGVRTVHPQPADGATMCEGLTECYALRTCLCSMCSRT